MKLTIPKPLKIWTGRVAAAVLAAVIDALQHGKLPHTTADALALVSGAVVAATPVLKASGLLRPVAPGDPSLAQKALAAVVAIVKAPAAQRQAKLAQDEAIVQTRIKVAVAAEVEQQVAQLEKSGMFWKGANGLQEQKPEDNSIPNMDGDGPEVAVPQEVAPAVAGGAPVP